MKQIKIDKSIRSQDSKKLIEITMNADFRNQGLRAKGNIPKGEVVQVWYLIYNQTYQPLTNIRENITPGVDPENTKTNAIHSKTQTTPNLPPNKKTKFPDTAVADPPKSMNILTSDKIKNSDMIIT